MIRCYTIVSVVLQAPLVEQAAQSASSAATAVDTPVEVCLQGLPQEALLSLCQTAAAAQMPLTAWLVLESLRRHGLDLVSMEWRDLVSSKTLLHVVKWTLPLSHKHMHLEMNATDALLVKCALGMHLATKQQSCHMFTTVRGWQDSTHTL